MTITIGVVQGPNLNLLGEREPTIYGTCSLDELHAQLNAEATLLGVSLWVVQSNSEGDLVDAIQQARLRTQGLIINAAAYTHTSVAIRDALAAYSYPIIEVHLSNIFKREAFRHHSYLSAVVDGVICGLSGHGYLLALQAMSELVSDHPPERSV